MPSRLQRTRPVTKPPPHGSRRSRNFPVQKISGFDAKVLANSHLQQGKGIFRRGVQPCFLGFFRQDERHSVMNARQSPAGRQRDDRAGLDNFSVRRRPAFPKPRESKRLVVLRVNEVRRLFACHGRPFVKPIEGNEAPPFSKGRTKRRQRRHRFPPSIDAPCTVFNIFGPGGNQSPPDHGQVPLPVTVANHGHFLSGTNFDRGFVEQTILRFEPVELRQHRERHCHFRATAHGDGQVARAPPANQRKRGRCSDISHSFSRRISLARAERLGTCTDGIAKKVSLISTCDHIIPFSPNPR